jgi:hypothetical protein
VHSRILAVVERVEVPCEASNTPTHAGTILELNDYAVNDYIRRMNLP